MACKSAITTGVGVVMTGFGDGIAFSGVTTGLAGTGVDTGEKVLSGVTTTEDFSAWKTGGISNFFSAIGSLAGGGEKVAAGAGGLGGGTENTDGGGGAGLGGAFWAATEAIASLTAELCGGRGTSALGAPVLGGS